MKKQGISKKIKIQQLNDHEKDNMQSNIQQNAVLEFGSYSQIRAGIRNWEHFHRHSFARRQKYDETILRRF